ncbi:MAG: hypothetical protein ABI076_12685 [Acidobacteriaceae bacterium]
MRKKKLSGLGLAELAATRPPSVCYVEAAPAEAQETDDLLKKVT